MTIQYYKLQTSKYCQGAVSKKAKLQKTKCNVNQ